MAENSPLSPNARTSLTLLDRLRDDDPQAWSLMVRLYTPLLLYWGRRLGLQDEDAADLVQDVLIVLVRKLPEFQYEAGRSWAHDMLCHQPARR